MAAIVFDRGKGMSHSLKKELVSVFDKIDVDVSEKNRIVIQSRKEAVLAVLSFLKNNGYSHLGIISCVDWIQEKAFELVYILSAYMKDNKTYTENEKINILVKTRIPREKPVFLSVIPIFENAEPYEREIHELFGIHFEGHPRLIPLFLERKYKIPPFRKDFDTRKYVKKTFESIPGIEEHKSTRAQEHKSIRAQEHKSTRAQEHKSTRAQEHKSTRAQEHKSTRAQEHKSTRA
ncbi:NADH-quinone oxidoreductase subunit C [bacterium]|nr:NADH-quinone oxidoreductase subunit C [bacterium]